MAETKPNEAKKGTPPEGFAPPEGLVDIGLPDVDGWYKPELMKGKWLQFKILGNIKINDAKRGTDRDVVIATVGKTGCTVVGAEDKDTQVELKLGQVIGIGVRAKLLQLLEYQRDSVLWIKPVKKKDIGGGQTMWTFEGPKLERGEKKSVDDIKRELARKPVQAGRSDESLDDDIPF